MSVRTVLRTGDVRYLWGLAAAAAIGAAVCLIEINVQSARVVDASGRAWPFSVLFGPGTARDIGWQELASGGLLSDGGLLASLLRFHVAVDMIFLIAFGVVLVGLVCAVFRHTLGRILTMVVVLVGVASDLVENALALSLAGVSGPASVRIDLLVTATTIKWCALAAVALTVLLRLAIPYRTPVETDARAALKRVGPALVHHRFSVAMIIPLFALTVLSGGAILEQLPDVQRRWVSDGAGGWLQAVAAVLAIVGAAALLELLGRFRTGWARRRVREAADLEPPGGGRAEPVDGPWLGPLIRRLARDVVLIMTMTRDAVLDRPSYRARRRYLWRRQEPLLFVWLVGPIIAMAGALLAVVGVVDAPVLLPRLLIFCAVPIAVALASWVLRRAWQIKPQWSRPDRPPSFSRLEVDTVAFVGHALALVCLTVGGLSLLRSFLSLLVLPPEVTPVSRSAGVIFFVVLGCAGVLLPWLVSWLLTAGRTMLPTERLASMGAREPRHLRWRWLLLGVILMIFFGMATLPTLAGRLGVSAVATLSLAALVGLVAANGLLLQERPTAEVFRLLGLRRTPLVSVLLITVLIVGLTSSTSSIHEIRSSGAQARPDTRPLIGDLVSAWVAESRSCTVRVDGHPVRPMLLVAAEGGGIRAAYWTVKGLDALATQTPAGCGSYATALSGGASGGSVGLTVARFSGTAADPGTGRAVAAVEAMAEPDTLSEAAIGTFIRDTTYGATGVPLPADGTVPARTWADRARLIELGWADARAAGSPAWGQSSFLRPPAELSPVTGALVLNASTVLNRCRAWVSQVRFDRPASARPPGEQDCEQREGPAARSIDVFRAYGPLGTPAVTGCLGDLTSSTAALLTARFPYVTPGGVAGACPVAGGAGAGASGADLPYWPRTQLVDGGYIENTGLATIGDLAGDWLAQVRSHNETAVAAGSSAPLIIPFVVFLTNDQPTAQRLTDAPGLQSELLLPPVTYLRGAASLNRTDALLQRAAATVQTDAFCPATRPGNAVDCAAVAAAFPRRVIVVDRATVPEVPAPLGWVLSQASMDALDSAIEHQVTTTCQESPSEPACRRGYGTLGELLGYLR